MNTHLVSVLIATLYICKDFSQGMTNKVRFTFNVGDNTTWVVYNQY